MLLKISLFTAFIIPGLELKNGQVWWAIVILALLLIALVMTEYLKGRDDVV